MKRSIIYITAFLLFSGVVTAQLLNKKADEAPESEDISAIVSEAKKEATLKLQPYRYDAAKVTYFIYKPFDQIKEIEVVFFNSVDYRLAFNSKAVQSDGISVKIYDKPQTVKERNLLFEKPGVKAGNNFEVTSSELTATLVSTLGKPELKLKKVYIDYVVPAQKREVHKDERTGEETTIRTKAAMVLSMGYQNI